MWTVSTRRRRPGVAFHLAVARRDSRAAAAHHDTAVVAAAIEQHCDDQGSVWPVPLAPFEAVVACLKPKNEVLMEAARILYDQLCEAGVDAMLDDRIISPGAKMKDLELLGFPYVILVGRDFEAEGKVEFRIRATGHKELVTPDSLPGSLQERLSAERRGLLKD